MRLFPSAAAAICAITLTACGAEEPPIEEILVEPVEPANSGLEERIPELEQCDADLYRPMIGTPAATAALPESDMLRVYGANDIVTQEYLPQRTNVVVGADGLIQQVTCG